MSEFENLNLSEVTPNEQFLSAYQFKVHVLIEGDRGSGKTYEANQLAESTGATIVRCDGHAGIDSNDLLGCLTPDSTGNSIRYIWKDGPVGRAFRLASKGIKTILIMDELLRIPQKELNVLLSALSPVNKKLYLRTGRIIAVEDGIGVEEVITAPQKNLWVIATTNVGSEYAIEDIDPALAERFIIMRKDTTLEQIKSICSNIAEKKGFDVAWVSSKMESFYSKMKEGLSRSLIVSLPTIRTLTRAIICSNVKEDIEKHLSDQILLWIDRQPNGDVDADKLNNVRASLYRIFHN